MIHLHSFTDLCGNNFDHLFLCVQAVSGPPNQGSVAACMLAFPLLVKTELPQGVMPLKEA
jgi:hypothetical protein